jgi:hypothetical protein
MQKELVSLLKSVAVVVAGVLLANAIEKKYMSTKNCTNGNRSLKRVY